MQVSDPDESGPTDGKDVLTLEAIVSQLKGAIEGRRLEGDDNYETESANFWKTALLQHLSVHAYAATCVPKLLILMWKWLLEVALLDQSEPKDAGGLS